MTVANMEEALMLAQVRASESVLRGCTVDVQSKQRRAVSQQSRKNTKRTERRRKRFHSKAE